LPLLLLLLLRRQRLRRVAARACLRNFGWVACVLPSQYAAAAG
jgi:hypothetical protein